MKTAAPTRAVSQWGAAAPAKLLSPGTTHPGLPRRLSGEEPPSAGDSGSNPGQGDLLEKVMATHSSIFAWKIPRTEDPGEL